MCSASRGSVGEQGLAVAEQGVEFAQRFRAFYCDSVSRVQCNCARRRRRRPLADAAWKKHLLHFSSGRLRIYPGTALFHPSLPCYTTLECRS